MVTIKKSNSENIKYSLIKMATAWDTYENGQLDEKQMKLELKNEAKKLLKIL